MPEIVEVNGQKKKLWNYQNPEDMRQLDEIVENDKKKLNISVKVDSEAIKAKEAELTAKLDKVEDKEQFFEDMKSKVEEKYIDKGLRIPNITDIDSFKDAIENLNKIEELEKNQNKESPTGQAPLSYGQIHGDNKEGFSSEREMIEVLRSQAHIGNKNAQVTLSKMFEKAVLGSKENEKGIKTFEATQNDESDLQRIQRVFREKYLKSRGLIQ